MKTGAIAKWLRGAQLVGTGIYLVCLAESGQQLHGLAPSIGAAGVEWIPAWTLVLWCALAQLPSKRDSLEEMQEKRLFALVVAWATPAVLTVYMEGAWRLLPNIDSPSIFGTTVGSVLTLATLLALAARALLARLPTPSFERRVSGTRLSVCVLLPLFVALVGAGAARRATRSTVDSAQLGRSFELAEGRESMRVPLSDGRVLVARRGVSRAAGYRAERVNVSQLDGLRERAMFDVWTSRADESASISIDERVGVAAVRGWSGRYRAVHSLQTGVGLSPWDVRARLAPGLLWIAQGALAAALLAYAMASHRRWRASREAPSIGPYRESASIVSSTADERRSRELARVQAILAVALAQGSPLLFALFAGMLGTS